MTETTTQTNRQALTAAFKTMRKLGHAARANFRCCMGCATAEAPADKIFFYWHSQDHAQAFPRDRWSGDRSEMKDLLYIGFCRPYAVSDETLLEAANALVAALKAEGFTEFEWDGTVSHRIGVKPVAGRD